MRWPSRKRSASSSLIIVCASSSVGAVLSSLIAPSSVYMSLTDLIRASQERRRNGKTERLRCLQTDDQLELRGLLDGQVARSRSFQDLVTYVAARRWSSATPAAYDKRPPASTNS